MHSSVTFNGHSNSSNNVPHFPTVVLTQLLLVIAGFCFGVSNCRTRNMGEMGYREDPLLSLKLHTVHLRQKSTDFSELFLESSAATFVSLKTTAVIERVCIDRRGVIRSSCAIRKERVTAASAPFDVEGAATGVSLSITLIRLYILGVQK
jgi:hypothetical protein